MSPEPRPPIDWSEALRLREEEGWSFAEIARKFGYAYETIWTGLSQRGAHGREPAIPGKAARKLRAIWRVTHEKCERPNHPSYRSFGAHGVRVAKEWAKFEAFYRWALANGYRPGLRLARVRGRGNYGPRNCCWVGAKDHARLRSAPRPYNRRKPYTWIDWEEATRLLREEGLDRPAIARRLDVSYTAIVMGFRRRGVLVARREAPTSTPEGQRLNRIWHTMRWREQGNVVREWGTFEPFLRWARTSGTEPGRCLTRINRSKPYGPGNCVWVPRHELKRGPPAFDRQPRRTLTAFGETQGLMQWSRDPRCKVTATTIAQRLTRGWNPKDAISEPAATVGYSGKELRAFGQTKSIAAWLRDRRCKVTRTGIDDRLRRGWTPEEAISTPGFGRPVGDR